MLYVLLLPLISIRSSTFFFLERFLVWRGHIAGKYFPGSVPRTPYVLLSDPQLQNQKLVLGSAGYGPPNFFNF